MKDSNVQYDNELSLSVTGIEFYKLKRFNIKLRSQTNTLKKY